MTRSPPDGVDRDKLDEPWVLETRRRAYLPVRFVRGVTRWLRSWLPASEKKREKQEWD